MEAVISGVLGELASRAISFIADKCREEKITEEDLQRLRRLLLRISTIVEEAEGRHVENRVMVRHVSTMREQMFRGCYLLDYFSCREKKTDHEEVSSFSFAQSKFNPAKRFRRLVSDTRIECTAIGSKENCKELKRVLLTLESMVDDMKEFAVFLMSYPRMYRQPYGAYLYLDKCMFGRQMEREQVISFLLRAEPLVGGNFGVLPIIGPGFVGKSTLVEHVCEDERVRNHFSLILLYSGNDLKDETATTFRDHCATKHQNIASGEERSLVIIELLGDVDEGAWKRLLRTSERYMAHGSKIIITSRSEKIASVGTTEAIKLSCLSKEAYWYFFKMLVFGSTDTEEHPKLTFIAMELALDMMPMSFISAYIVAALLRANRSAQFWRRVHIHLRQYCQKNLLLLGQYPVDEGQPRYIWSMTRKGEGYEDEDLKFLLVNGGYQKGPASRSEVPRISVMDLLYGTWGAMPRGKFEVLTWRSLIPPYYIYTADCEFVRGESNTTG
uniref:Uncharacterized protein n=1 Tax=Avena sativa TaxID=4498 RepID=A0ACD5T861_AVESA